MNFKTQIHDQIRSTSHILVDFRVWIEKKPIKAGFKFTDFGIFKEKEAMGGGGLFMIVWEKLETYEF